MIMAAFDVVMLINHERLVPVAQPLHQFTGEFTHFRQPLHLPRSGIDAHVEGQVPCTDVRPFISAEGVMDGIHGVQHIRHADDLGNPVLHLFLVVLQRTAHGARRTHDLHNHAIVS